VAVIDAIGAQTRYHYDALGNLVKLASPDTGITDYEYDEAGNRLAAIDARGVRTEFRHDALNRLIEVVYPDPSLNITYSYDAGVNGSGRLTGMTDAWGSVSYQYNAAGNLVREDRWQNGQQAITEYAYNPAGRRTHITYPSELTVEEVRGEDGRVVSLRVDGETLVESVDYEPQGPVRSFTYGNGLTYSAVYDHNYQAERLQSGPMDWQLDYGPAGNLLSIQDGADPAANQSFGYDAVYRLVHADGPYGVDTFEYDANGNRLRRVKDSGESLYGYESLSNRLVSIGSLSMQRDAAGNRIAVLDSSDSGQIFHYGQDNRLAKFAVRTQGVEDVHGEYRYDGRGRRIAKITAAGEIRFIYGPGGALLGEYPADDPGASREYVYLNGLPVAVVDLSDRRITPPGEEIIVDDGDPGTSGSGRWRSYSMDTAHNSDALFANKAANARYRWETHVPWDRFKVQARWTSKGNQSDQVNYRIGAGEEEFEQVSRSHKSDGGSWQELGNYESSENLVWVEVSSSQNKFVADAIRWSEITDPVLVREKTVHFIHFDHLGTPRRVTDQDQSLVWLWESAPFGDTLANEDPDGDGTSYRLNLRFPGQYFDIESGLHYNYFRHYGPEIGRYMESDPIGLNGGLNTFAYVGANPLSGMDPLGLEVVGNWMEPPRFSLVTVGVEDWQWVSPTWSWWGYARFIRLYGYATGFINVDVKCENDCGEWEIHHRVLADARGHHDVGLNLYALIIGLRTGPIAGVGANVAIGGAALLEAEHHYLSLVNEKAGSLISSIMNLGPTGICLKTTTRHGRPYQ
jgi:RHS repeat-associated protein